MFATDRELQNQIAALEVLALDPAIDTADLESFRPAAERFLTRFPEGTGVSLSDRDGRQVFITNARPGDPIRVRTDTDTIAAIFSEKKPQVSNIYLSRFTGQPTFTVDVPVIRGGNVLYDLAFNTPKQNFFDILAGLDLPEGWVAAIFDGNYNIIARRPAIVRPGITRANPALREALKVGGDRVTQTVSLVGKPILAAFAYSPETTWVVGVSVPLEVFEAPSFRALLVAVSGGTLLMLIGGYFAVRIATQLVRAERHRELLVNELNHRVKNTLSSVQAIVWRGLRSVGEETEARENIDARLQALSAAHNILSSQSWEGAHFKEIATSIVGPYAGPHGVRMHASGPEVAIKPKVAIALAMILNELATNAVKYGALMAATAGTIALAWALRDAHTLVISWTETGGPAVAPPQRTGYGTKFIERAVVDELGGRYRADFRPEGFACAIEIPL